MSTSLQLVAAMKSYLILLEYEGCTNLIRVRFGTTILGLHNIVTELYGLVIEDQLLMFDGKKLNETNGINLGSFIGFLNIEEGSKIFVYGN
jgi:hypothetical protein